jgi:hypothetical protein
MKFAALLALVFALSLTASVSARQYPNGQGQIVHTNVLPVLVHGISPPFTGIHIWEKGPRNR